MSCPRPWRNVPSHIYSGRHTSFRGVPNQLQQILSQHGFAAEEIDVRT